MPPLDDEVAQLYQLPLDAFTRARNALAKRVGGAEGAAIKALVKPQRSAWVVNQLYWRHRETFDRLVKASEAVRAAHRRLVAGTPVDLHATEAAHREVLAQARDDARSVLRDAGEDISPALLGAVTDTLRALPTADPQGRLTHPLSPTSGFEAFAGVAVRVPGTGAPHPPPAPVLRLHKGAATKGVHGSEAARAIARVRAELERARARARDAEKALDALAKSLAQAERARERCQVALDAAAGAARELSTRLTRAKQVHQAARHERERLERRLALLEG